MLLYRHVLKLVLPIDSAPFAEKNSLMAYSKIRQPKLSDVIEQQLEYLILEGTLRPGEKLPPERELAKQFDVSRPSLRGHSAPGSERAAPAPSGRRHLRAN